MFGEAVAANANEVLGLWDQVKLAEGKAEDGQDVAPKGLLDGVPKGFPALMQAQKVSRKAAAVGFEWESVEDVWAKVAEEIDELKTAYEAAPRSADGKILKEEDPSAAQAVELEVGDVLFALVNVARKMGVNAENALRATCVKFRSRWSFMEGAAWGMGKRIEELSSDELEELWGAAKMLEATSAATVCADELSELSASTDEIDLAGAEGEAR